MQLPAIHNNGTSAQSLFDQYRRAYEAVQEARKALGNVEVHGRDYYVIQEGDATATAFKEHRERVATLATIETDLMSILIHIKKQADEQKKPIDVW